MLGHIMFCFCFFLGGRGDTYLRKQEPQLLAKVWELKSRSSGTFECFMCVYAWILWSRDVFKSLKLLMRMLCVVSAEYLNAQLFILNAMHQHLGTPRLMPGYCFWTDDNKLSCHFIKSVPKVFFTGFLNFHFLLSNLTVMEVVLGSH